MRTTLHVAALAAVLASALSAQGAVTSPCYHGTLGTALNLGDDQVAVNQALGFSFPGPAGPVTAISISSNGFVWLGNNPDPSCCNGDGSKLVSQMARIAPMWMDLNPSAGGNVWFDTFPASGSTPAGAAITWAGVPEYPNQGAVTVQLQMFADGSFSTSWDSLTGVSGHTALVGVSQGVNATPNSIDISQTASTPYDSGANPTVYEELSYYFDLTATVFTWVPNGLGGYQVTQKLSCPFATTTRFGAGCPLPVIFYELFDQLNPIDLSNMAIEFTPNGQGGYIGLQIPGFFTGYTNLQVFGDDDSHGPFALPFPFVYPGGVTTAIDISSNGFIWLQAGNGNSRCCFGDPYGLTNDPASICGLWMDLFPPGATAPNGIYFDTTPTEAHITWVNVPEFYNTGSNTFQITLRANGSFRLSYGAVANVNHDAVVGFSQGSGSTIPASIDLSVVPILTPNGGTPLLLDAQPGSRPGLGTTFTMDVSQITPGSLIGLMVLGTISYPNGIDLTPIGMPNCSLYASLDALLSYPLTGPTTPFSFPIPPTPGLAGLLIETQAATLTPGVNAMGLCASNGLELLLGI
jgi:hypothetical protein